MNSFYLKTGVLSLTIVFLLGTVSKAQKKDINTISYVKAAAASGIPLNPKIKKGTLANGFEYYILKNSEPKDKMIMYLANKVGAVLETDTQRGLAHFLEHMNFNGTTHYPKNELVDYLQRWGIRFGADLNAYTGFDETVYQLPLPSNNPELLKQGLIIMRDWAHGALLEDSEIDQERGVILEEKRQRGGISDRFQEKIFPIVTNRSRYLHRLPIGVEDVLKNFKYIELRNFYKDWYRPDLQALIVVGDIDENTIEKEVIQLFSDLKNPKNAPKRKYYDIKLTGENQFLQFTDEEVSSVNLEIAFKAPLFNVKTKEDYKTLTERTLFTQILNARLVELGRKANTPFLSADFGVSELMGGLETRTIRINPKPGKLKESIFIVLETFEQVRQYGFTASELQRAKANYVKSLERNTIENNKKTSESYVNEILDYFLRDQPAPAFDYILPLFKKNIEQITAEDIRKHAALFTASTDRDIFLSAPQSKLKELPTEKDIVDWIDAAGKVTPLAYQEDVIPQSLIGSLPAPGKIIDRKKDDLLGTQTLTLSNGVKVVMKPTDFKNDEILISSFSPGGYSLYGMNDFQSAAYATSVVTMSGLGPFNASQFSKFLAGKNVSISPFITETGEGIRANTTKKDLQMTLEVLYSYFYQAKFDRDQVSANLEKAKFGLENRLNNALNFFSEEINKVLYNNDSRKTGPSIQKIDAINPDRAFEIFKDRFADASDFNFFIVGNFDPIQIEPFVLQYLGTLPNLGRREQFVDNASYPPDKGLSLDIHKGKEEKATVVMSYLKDYDYNDENNMLMDALSSCIKIKLEQRLREKESGIYSASVYPQLSKIPRQRFGLNISFSTDPNLVQKLTDATLDEIDRIKKEGPSQVDIDKYIAEKLLANKQLLRQNNFWLNYLQVCEIENKNPQLILNQDERLKRISKDRLKAIAEKYLSSDHFFRFVLYPESK